MPKEIIESSAAPVTGFTDATRPSPLAQAIKAGDFVFVSGQGPLDPETKQVISNDIVEQTQKTLSNLQHVIEAAGANLSQIVNMRVCLRDTKDFARFNEAFRDFFSGVRVTRTCIGATPHRDGVNVEIDCVVYLG